MRVELFDFDLPEERIALRPVDPRDSAKMLVLKGDTILDHVVSDLSELLNEGDALVFNDTKVLPVKLSGVRERDGAVAQVNAMLHTRISPDEWICYIKGSKKIKPGDHITFGDALQCNVIKKSEAGDIWLRFEQSGETFDAALHSAGAMPLPPYIAGKRAADIRDVDDYQTVYARKGGAVAAPTAGLHFTDSLLNSLEKRNIGRHFVTLHVGPGTFLPMKAEDTRDHKMHSEWGSVSAETAQALNRVRKSGGRIISVGTTSLRLLESAARENGVIEPWEGDTDIFITPGYEFRAVDVLMTNFHLPKSTLFMLVSAFCGLETMKNAYAHAIENEYRFYSYGDSSLLFKS